MDCSLPGSSVHGILQARTLEWVAFPPSGDLPYPGIEPVSLRSSALEGVFFTTSTTMDSINSKSLHVLIIVDVQLSHPYMTTGKTIALTIWTFVGKVMSLLFNMLSRFVIAFLPKSKCLLTSWLQSPSTVILEPKKIKSVTFCIFSSSICYEVMGTDAMIFVFFMLSFKPGFLLFSFTFIKRLFSSSLLSAIRVVLYAYLRLLIFLQGPWF